MGVRGAIDIVYIIAHSLFPIGYFLLFQTPSSVRSLGDILFTLPYGVSSSAGWCPPALGTLLTLPSTIKHSRFFLPYQTDLVPGRRHLHLNCSRLIKQCQWRWLSLRWLPTLLKETMSLYNCPHHCWLTLSVHRHPFSYPPYEGLY